MTGEKLTVALTYQATGFQDLAELSDELGADGQAADQVLDEAARKVDKLLAATGAVPAAAIPTSTTPRPRQTNAVRERTSWQDMVAESERRLRARGIDTSEVDIDELLDPAEVKRLNRRHEGGFKIHADLDAADISISIAAGLVAALIDVLVVRIPQDSQWWTQGDGTDTGSTLTAGPTVSRPSATTRCSA